MTGHFTYETGIGHSETYCGHDALHVRYAVDLDTSALYVVDWLTTHEIEPCRKCVKKAKELVAV